MGKTLLAVLAHPDDETFGMGGTLALYAQKGVEVHLVCATRGEAGEMDPEYMNGFKSIAERRESELRCAAQHLGLKGVHFLGYRDSGMPGSPDNKHPQALCAQPVEEVAAGVVQYIRMIKPQVVITFDPIGGYRHPDHIAMHNATVKAFSLAGDPTYHSNGLSPYQPQKLYYHTVPNKMLRVAVRMMQILGQDPRHMGKNKDIDLVSLTEVSFPVHARIDYRPVMKVRDEATACHASQGGSSLMTGVMAQIRRWFVSYETYMRAYPEAAPDMPVERDLFEGVIV
ncbi:MAG: GlcNAc-PI de-N-acetylase [Chloroflexi bacterium]|nr:GlcNAc-PI de-N-acetylase [Chloroflexota bacterium]